MRQITNLDGAGSNPAVRANLDTNDGQGLGTVKIRGGWRVVVGVLFWVKLVLEEHLVWNQEAGSRNTVPRPIL